MSSLIFSAYLHLLRDKPVQPACVNAVVLKALCLQQLDEVFHCGPEVSSDRQFFQSNHHVAGKKNETQLGVSHKKLQATV